MTAAPNKPFRLDLLVSLFAILPTFVVAQSYQSSAAHPDPVAPVVLALAVILGVAKLEGHLAAQLGQPAVLGELVAGVALGSFDLFGIGWFRSIEGDPTVEILARLGVLILLFEVGLESTVRDMLKVGWTSVLVAVLEVLAPFALGWGVSAWMLPDKSAYVHAFLGATLTATSVGITARVLQDLHRSQSPEARVILGAAVVDDVLGLVILAVVAGAIGTADHGGSLSYADVGFTLGKAIVFLFSALMLGVYLSPRVFGLASHLSGQGVLLVTALVFCFRPRLSGFDHWARCDRGCLCCRPDPRGRTFSTVRQSWRAAVGASRPSAIDLSCTRVLRRDGHARGFDGVRPTGCSWARGAAHRCRNDWEAGVRNRCRWQQARSDIDRDRDDAPRRSWPHLREYWPWAKVRWKPKQNQFFPDATVPGDLVNVDFMAKDGKRFADSGGCTAAPMRP